MTKRELFIQRCFDLAILGTGKVAPNPMVGAVIVYNGRIIGEGYHKKYGEAHAEVNAIAGIQAQDRQFLPRSTMYISLEPCCIHSKTPPCTNLILENKIPKIVISSLDHSPAIKGKSVTLLREAGVEVVAGVLKKKGEQLANPHHIFVKKRRPYVVLKFAKTLDEYFAGQDGRQFWITNSLSKRLVHKWRSETDAILVGTNTAKSDNPQLTNRLYFGGSPLRIVMDRYLRLNRNLSLFDRSAPSIVATAKNKKTKPEENVNYIYLDFEENVLPQLLDKLHQMEIGTLLVEGGAKLIQSFIDEELWDEARVLLGNKRLKNGLPSPIIPRKCSYSHQLDDDQLLIYYANAQ